MMFALYSPELQFSDACPDLSKKLPAEVIKMSHAKKQTLKVICQPSLNVTIVTAKLIEQIILY